MIELYNAIKFISMLIFYQNILTFNLGVAFLKSVSIVLNRVWMELRERFNYILIPPFIYK